MKIRHLLAKSTKDPKHPRREETLVGHTEAVLEAATVVGEVLGKDIVSVLGESFEPEFFQEALFCSAWLHDLGKANDHFQKMIRNHKFRQGIRHETLGIVIIWESLTPWLEPVWTKRNYPKCFWPTILHAVSGHHLKFPDNRDRSGTEVCFLGKHREMEKVLEIGKVHFGLNHVPDIGNRMYSLTLGGIRETLNNMRRRLDSDASPHEKLFAALLKSTLICCDVAGSALPDKIRDDRQSIREWLKKRVTPVLQKAQLESVVRQKLQDSAPRHFQQQVRDSDSGTILLEAGYGAGKTAAAYLWASRNADGKRLFFCYPTTATASEGFAGYLHDPDFEAILVNSRAKVDYKLLENMPIRTTSQIELRNLRLETLETWPIPAVVCTVHTVLGILQNTRRGIFALPSLVRSAFVFDEIHAYSPKLFQHLLRFLEIFSNVPVLLMTATLPLLRKKMLENVCKKRGGVYSVKGPAERENAKRYAMKRCDEENAWENVHEALNEGGKVLWVCNTVVRAMGIAERAYKQGLPVQPFHSRYRYKDRLLRQRQVVDGFLPGESGMLAVTTQVAEMSLDLSADSLITEYAPIASLIQRLGRLNRFEDIPRNVRPALFLKPSNAMPYAKREEEDEFLEKVDSWLDMVCDEKPKSQKELAEAFVSIENKVDSDFDDGLLCDWIDDPWVSLTNRKSLMEGSYTIDLVREEDYKTGHLDENVLPMPFPRGKAWGKWARKGRYFIAPTGTIDYDSFWGGKYAEEQSDAWII